MRRLPLLAVALLVVLAGCSFGFGGNGNGPAETETATPAANGTVTPAGTGPGGSAPADPAADRLGWHDGYWHNESLGVDQSDGLNESELDAVVARSIARIETVREREFTEDVPVEIISREELEEQFDTDYSEDFRTFDNAKFEALFMVGSDTDALQVQQDNQGASVLGFYEPANDTISLVAEDGSLTIDDETVLGHEIHHALQDQLWNLTELQGATRDEFNANNALIEGEANLVQSQYRDRCGLEWECLSTDGGGAIGSGLHYGIYFLEYFRYADGEVFVRHHYDDGGWDAVDALWDDPPDTAVEVIHPDRYGQFEATDVSLTDDLNGDWRRVRPSPQSAGSSRPDYATLGQAALTATFAHTFTSQLQNTPYDSYNESSVISRFDFITSDQSDPYNYDIDYASGWTGDRLHVYERGDETAYAWRLTWADAAEAEEFAAGYRDLLSHWGGDRVGGNTWRISTDSPFTGAYYLQVDGDEVTVVKAPSEAALSDVAPAGVTPE